MPTREQLQQLVSNCENAQNTLVQQCVDYAQCCGLTLRRKGEDGTLSLCTGKITVVPSHYPESAYSQALRVQPVYNKLYHLIAHCHPFLKQALARTVEADDFMRKLWGIYETVRKEGLAQPISLVLSRSDYMFTQTSPDSFCVKQIEMNTIASSMAALSLITSKTHRYLAGVFPDTIHADKFPTNEALNILAHGIHQAWKKYNNPQAAVMFLVDSEEGNFSDLRSLQYAIEEIDIKLRIVYFNFKSLASSDACLDQNKRLVVNGKEVACIYYRYGYSPDHYSSDTDWQMRLMLERSTAIKCPSIHYHLAGSKAIQQELTKPGVVEQFISPEESDEIRKTFVQIYNLSKNDGGDEWMQKAYASPEDYVLKPQREGGGNNFYDEDILKKWEEIKETGERDGYILMERIKPPTQINCCVPCNNAQCSCVPTINELGIYGAVLGDEHKILLNETGGYLLRTKPAEVGEGGFFAGFSAIDTPELVKGSDFIEYRCC